MRLRTILFFVFCVIAVAPLILFWVLPNSQVFNDELDDVREQHLLIAKNLSGELSRYHLDLEKVFSFVRSNYNNISEINNLDALFETLDIRHFCVADASTGEVLNSIHAAGPQCPKFIPQQRLAKMLELTSDNPTSITTTGVFKTPDNENILYLLNKVSNILFVGAVRTRYLRDVGNRISFGELGHAAIVDKNGRAISHPLGDWEENAHDMSKIAVVQKMLAGETGVEMFYSPALETDMVAGFTSVEGPGWGIMVPQPVRELEAKANSVKSAGITVLAFGLALAAVVAYFASKILTHPFEQMVAAMHRIGAGELRAYEGIKQSAWQPVEFNAARDGIKAMSERLQENIDTISRHAYLDGITGLPNRECFRVLAQEEIDKMRSSRMKCAILFLDLDGFKQVNDVYGHRSGDDLLKGFANKLHAYCGHIMKRNARGADNALRILPARLGGDEFVVLLSNMSDMDFPGEFAQGLFQKVFGPFKIHNGVSLQVSGSVGGAVFPDQAGDFDELLRLADIAMYDAKNNGKGRFSLYSPAQEPKTSASSEQMQSA